MNERQRERTGCGRGLARRHWLALSLCALGILGIFGPGCHSPSKADPTGFASVEIHGNTPGQIRNAAVAVFQAHEYKVAKAGLNNLVFEKEGSQWDNVAYGNWIGDTPIWLRVKASIVPVAETTFRLQCRAFMLRGRAETTEEEISVSKYRSGPYQKLLDEVAARLGGAPAQ